METVQAPNIEPGAKGRLVYDKAKHTIVGKQVIEPHLLAQFGYRRMPHRLWRVSPRAWVIASALQDIWLIAIGRCTLHRAWQAGYDRHCSEEFGRRLRGGGQ